MEPSVSNAPYVGMHQAQNKKNNDNENNQQDEYSEDFSDKRLFFIRVGVFGIFVTVLILGKAFGQPYMETACIHDVLMNFLQPINNLINTNMFWRNALQALSSFMLDVIFIATIVPWLFNGKTGRIMYAFGLFYLIRGLVQQLVIFGFPPGYLWDSPTFPSLVVPYGRYSDFFFSGHVGFLIILASENYAQGRKSFCYAILLCTVYLIFVLVSYRVHYTCDIVAGLFISHWVFLICNMYKNEIDDFFRGGYIMFLSVLRKNRAKNPQEDQSQILDKNAKSNKSPQKEEQKQQPHQMKIVKIDDCQWVEMNKFAIINS